MTPINETRCSRFATPGGSERPRAQISRKPSEPMVSASARNHSQRTTCSIRVGPPAPYASVGGNAFTRRPNVQTPDTTCPSEESACQRTVYGPVGSCRTFATTFRPLTRAAPA